MVPTKKEELRNLVTQTTLETYEELTPHLVQLITPALCRARSRLPSW